MWFVLATNPAQKKSSKVEHGFKVTSDGRLIIRDEDEDAGDDGKGWISWLVYLLRARCEENNMVIFTDDGEMKDILEEAGVKSVSTSVQVYDCSVVDACCLCFNLFGPSEKDTEKEVQRWQL